MGRQQSLQDSMIWHHKPPPSPRSYSPWSSLRVASSSLGSPRADSPKILAVGTSTSSSPPSSTATLAASSTAIDEIVRDPWFMNGKQSYYVKQGQINNSECDDYLLKSSGVANSMNAFDLISFSTGFDLSGLFSDYGKCVAVATELFVCSESMDKVVEMVEDGAKRLELGVKRKESVVVLVGKKGECVVE
ncbi:hypothetical protein Syun_025293 [Stephania yunnanensis]|uniref:NAF domain-containing protein n=1 Tax=Stephania yunnanensis TaxID=152371 RepID=A0AAP0HR47_9MAGN